eukprot:59829-Amphidinium_carterae.1
MHPSKCVGHFNMCHSRDSTTCQVPLAMSTNMPDPTAMDACFGCSISTGLSRPLPSDLSVLVKQRFSNQNTQEEDDPTPREYFKWKADVPSQHTAPIKRRSRFWRS